MAIAIMVHGGAWKDPDDFVSARELGCRMTAETSSHVAVASASQAHAAAERGRGCGR